MLRANVRIIAILVTAFLVGTFLISTYRRAPSNSPSWSSLNPTKWSSSSGSGLNGVESTSQDENDLYHTGRPGSGTAGGTGEDTMSEKEKEAAKDRLKVQYGDVTTTANKVKGQTIATTDAAEEDQMYAIQTPTYHAQTTPTLRRTTPSGTPGKKGGSTLKTVTKPASSKESSAATAETSAEPFEEFAPSNGATTTAIEFEDYLTPDASSAATSTARRKVRTSAKASLHPTAPGPATPTDPWATYIDDLDEATPTSKKLVTSKVHKPTAANTQGVDALQTTAVEYEDYLTDASPTTTTAIEFADYVAGDAPTTLATTSAAHRLDIFGDDPHSLQGKKASAVARPTTTRKNALAAEATRAAAAADEYLEQLSTELREES